jgi:UDP-2,3-diacylglucosamine pyrophosphatase LpxH
MSTIARQVYVISDLHIGGEQGAPGERGFRICTHVKELATFVDALAAKPAGAPAIELVINGDFVDFLAERRPEAPAFVPFVADPAAAVRQLERIVARDRDFFDALGRLLARGHDLTILLGNHDVELSVPPVRRALAKALGTSERRFRFVYDNEGYIAGDALIEHGNRYDSYNMVDHDRLRRFRSLCSRRQVVPREHVFDPPAGSKLVSEVMNPIKDSYRFVDLLKPETAAVMPLLLALEPGYKKKVISVLPLAYEAGKHEVRDGATPVKSGDISATGAANAAAPSKFGGDMGGFGGFGGGDMGGMGGGGLGRPASSTGGAASAENARLEKALGEVLGKDARTFLTDTAAPAANGQGDISTGIDFIDRALGLASLFFNRSKDLDKRLPALLKAIRALQGEHTFDRATESTSAYIDAAEDLVMRGEFHYVVFGHTHIARDVQLSNGSRYFNTGTWADIIKFPAELLTKSDEEAIARLRVFVEDMAAGRLDAYLQFIPTYVRLDVDDADHVAQGGLYDFTDPARV